MELKSKVFEEEVRKINTYTEIYREYLREKGWAEKEKELDMCLSLIQSLIGLYETYGDVSSVVSFQEDPEVQSLKNLYDIYAQVKLKDHARNVLHNAISYFESEKRIAFLDKSLLDESFSLYLTYTLMALGHDLGKIPEVRKLYEKGGYSLGDHAYYSYLFLKTGLENAGLREEEWKHVLKAVREHHFPSSDRWVRLLKKFDQEAREYEGGLVAEEKIRISELFEPVELEVPEWLTEDFMKEVFQELKKYINVIAPENRRYKGKLRWVAVSQPDGLIYVFPDFLLDLVRSLAIRRGIRTPLWFFDESERWKGMLTLAKVLTSMEATVVPEGKVGVKAKVKVGSYEKEMFFIPVQSWVFGEPVSVFEERRKKDSFLRWLRIEPRTRVLPLDNER